MLGSQLNEKKARAIWEKGAVVGKKKIGAKNRSPISLTGLRAFFCINFLLDDIR